MARRSRCGTPFQDALSLLVHESHCVLCKAALERGILNKDLSVEDRMKNLIARAGLGEQFTQSGQNIQNPL